MGLFVERIATYAVDEQREMDISPARHAGIGALGSRCFGDFGLLALGAK